MKEIEAVIGESRYTIEIGNRLLLDSQRLKEKISGSGKCAVVLSNYLYDLHWEYLIEVLGGYTNKELFLMQDSEENKNYIYAENFLQGFAVKGLARDSLVWSIGGGVVGDFAGYCASLYMRGINIVQCPTTLLAMVDAGIGGKVAVNLQSGKNLVGSFHQPILVVSDTVFLSTLPDREIKCGLAEIIKHSLIGDAASMDILLKHNLESVKDESVLSELVYHSAKFKVSVVAADEKEEGLRAILNFGHTVGHAVESFMAYKDISHGEAVAAGILAESRISKEAGLLSADGLELVVDLLKRYDLFDNSINCGSDGVIEHMKFDKKNKENSVRFVLLKAPGEALYNQTVPNDIINRAVEETLA
ncbi:MAG: 3-dehydroquinate synthase [Spirochaetia bacterium]|jgi:3-dehydroquinate synthase|nr:3-dehydroquinate synthase [Spirochaetia bacterium]